MDVPAAAVRWVETWRRAWPDRDTDAVVALYAPAGTHRSAPFREELAGRRAVDGYFRAAFGSETGVARVWFGDPVVSGGRAAVEWWAEVVAEDGPATLAGCSVLTFDRDGLVAEQRDYWHDHPGHVQRPFLD